MKKITGWLIVNEYLNTDKFVKLHELFFDAAKNKGIELKKYTNAEFLVRCDENVVYSTAFDEGRPDYVIFYDKDIVLARALEDMGLRLFNSSEAIKICDSKLLTEQAVSEVETIPTSDIGLKMYTPITFAVPFTYENIGIKDNASFRFLDEIEKQIPYPFIIKESYSSFGMGVHMAKNREEAIEIFCKVGNKECVIQEYIGDENCHGARDIRIQMVGEKCVAAMERSNEADYRANLTNGGKMKGYDPKECEIELAVTAMKKIGLDFAGIDIMFDKNGNPVFCEANSNAHFKNLYDLTGINTAEYILDYILEQI